jgi:hypothetical protein
MPKKDWQLTFTGKDRSVQGSLSIGSGVVRRRFHPIRRGACDQDVDHVGAA